ncbi:uncharacterized protein LOC131162472 isoform X2 [Malania oleifera]|uniref:uncharacterized protein LOC131162472 isoform X2 n=1 Tax=Malania oleifera TaxID=397392 RepID=UPI0025AE100E|nr:uncharacterized protein LOC131162472 isoform X2 [Malania oleifera]
MAMGSLSSLWLRPLLVLRAISLLKWAFATKVSHNYISAIGDPGMKNPNVRIAFEAWNFCNEVGQEAHNMGSPRLADCADLYCPLIRDPFGSFIRDNGSICQVHHKVEKSDNKLGAGDKFPVTGFEPYRDPDLYAMEKERYLASLCEVFNFTDPWYFWMIMLKNGNFDKNTTLCPENGRKVSKIVTDRQFPCFGEGCMNQPLVYHNCSRVVSFGDQIASLTGGFYGTYDLDADLSKGIRDNSFFSVSWQKDLNTSSWIFSQRLTTSVKYPWLMLYLRADAVKGFNGGYHYDGRGIMKKLPVSPNFKVKLTLDIKSGGGPNSQFYLLDIGSCWKNNGCPCDGDVLTDTTRYSEMIINPETTSWCRLDNLRSCPPYHELVQILPHPEWAVHGYPSEKGDGWVGDSRTWDLDVGGLSDRLYFYQDPGTKPAKRIWSSIDVGTEIYVSHAGVTAEWSVSDFDILIPEDVSDGGRCA